MIDTTGKFIELHRQLSNLKAEKAHAITRYVDNLVPNLDGATFNALRTRNLVDGNVEALFQKADTHHVTGIKAFFFKQSPTDHSSLELIMMDVKARVAGLAGQRVNFPQDSELNRLNTALKKLMEKTTPSSASVIPPAPQPSRPPGASKYVPLRQRFGDQRHVPPRPLPSPAPQPTRVPDDYSSTTYVVGETLTPTFLGTDNYYVETPTPSEKDVAWVDADATPVAATPPPLEYAAPEPSPAPPSPTPSPEPSPAPEPAPSPDPAPSPSPSD